MKKLNILKYAALLLCFSACSSQREVVSSAIVSEQVTYVPDPGAVEFVYEPPLVDVIQKQPGLDPDGIYYVPAHQEIVEIRPGRWKYYKQPAEAIQ